MTSRELTALLKGRTIHAVHLRPFGRANGGHPATNPLIVLSDGTAITFAVQEVDDMDYGVGLEIRDRAGVYHSAVTNGGKL